MKNETIKTDITVVGGGLAGVCAAVAAARLGRTVALVQNRPVLGGNSSSEVRVWVCGATGHGTQRYARETGIMGEMFVENQYLNPDGNPYLWDLVILETVKAEKNIQLFLNTDVHEVEAEGDEQNRIINSVTGWMMGSERRIRFESGMFLDCTGDGLLGFLAGAKYRIGREAKNEYNEEWAPDAADDITLGSTILFYTKDAGHPVKFVPPSFAKDITQTSIPMKRVIRSGDSGCHYWWIEWGGELDTVHENERIRDELWSVIYGIWDYIKNSGKFDAENMTLEWVGSLPGKREYRRFIGDYVLNQNDILEQKPFEDRIAFGGWSIDLHPPQGMYSTESGSKHLYMNGNYHIPFRSLYSQNVSNLLFAGRNVSATHVAFGTTRVMATCAVIGEAAGTGAALSLQKGVMPRELHKTYIKELQQVMLRQDASIIGLANEDDTDLARQAVVSASSVWSRVSAEQATDAFTLNKDLAVLYPVANSTEGLELLVTANDATHLEVELWDTGRKENYIPDKLQASALVHIGAGEKQWITLPLSWNPDEAQNAFVVIKSNEAVQVYHSDERPTGALFFERVTEMGVPTNLEDQQAANAVLQWSMKGIVNKRLCFRALSSAGVYGASKVTDGYNRPYGGPHMWVSEPTYQGGRTGQEWLKLSWKKPVKAVEVHLTFNDDVNEDLINLHHHRTPFDVIPELVKDYRIEAQINGKWVMIAEEKNNRRRKRVHLLVTAVTTDQIRLIVESTNGGPRAEVIEVRVYADRHL